MPPAPNDQVTSPTRTPNLAKTHESTSTLRRPPHTYIHLSITRNSLLSTPSASTLPPLDEITLRAHLTAALNQYLGLTGTAIPVDILRVEPGSHEGWIRLPREDESAIVAALAQWVGGGKGGVSIRVNARGAWLGGLIARGRRYGGGNEKLWSLER